MTDAERLKWLQDRKSGIGGSDLAGLLGLSPYSSPERIYADKTSAEIRDDETEAMEWGRRIEPAIREAYVDKTGRAVDTPAMMRHPDNPHHMYTPDGLTADGEAVLECKHIFKPTEEWGPHGSDQIPVYYMCQVQWGMHVTGRQRADLAAKFAMSSPMFRVYQIPRSQRFIDLAVEAVDAMWTAIVNRDPPPDVAAALRAAGGGLLGGIEGPEDVARMVVDLCEVKAEISGLEKRESELSDGIKMAMGSYTRLLYGDVAIATLNEEKRSSLDTKTLKAEMPEVYGKYLRQSATRVLRLIKK